jgi:hypothetical protein
VTSTSHVSLIVTFSPPARAMYLIGDMTARTRLTPSSYSSSKVVRAGEVRIPCCGPRTAELLVDPILSRTHPHCSGSSDHPRSRLHLTSPCSLVLFVRKWFKQQSCAERIHGSLSLYGYCPSTESTLPYYPLQRVCISPSVLHIGDPRTRSPLALCCVFAISGFL